MSLEKLEILCCGLNVVDVLTPTPRDLRNGSKHEVSEIMVQGGAPAGNAACVLAALGAKTGYLTHMGDNLLSEISRSELVRWNVREDYFIHKAEAHPGIAVVEIDAQGERTVFYSLKNYCSITSQEIPQNLNEKTQMVLVDGYETLGTIPLLEEARKKGVVSVLDMEAGDLEVMKKMISLADHAILPFEAAKKVTGEESIELVCQKMRGLSSHQVVITDGEKGSWAIIEKGIHHQAIFKVPVVDTTGCGDSYHGAYAFALLQGWALPLRMEFSAWIASFVAGVMGGRTDLPTPEKIRKFDLSVLSLELQQKIKEKFL